MIFLSNFQTFWEIICNFAALMRIHQLIIKTGTVFCHDYNVRNKNAIRTKYQEI